MAERKSAKKGKASSGFTAEERAAMRERAGSRRRARRTGAAIVAS